MATSSGQGAEAAHPGTKEAVGSGYSTESSPFLLPRAGAPTTSGSAGSTRPAQQLHDGADRREQLATGRVVRRGPGPGDGEGRLRVLLKPLHPYTPSSTHNPPRASGARPPERRDEGAATKRGAAAGGTKLASSPRRPPGQGAEGRAGPAQGGCEAIQSEEVRWGQLKREDRQDSERGGRRKREEGWEGGMEGAEGEGWEKGGKRGGNMPPDPLLSPCFWRRPTCVLTSPVAGFSTRRDMCSIGRPPTPPSAT
ncbi:hypothetical protein DFH08DRAFT_825126 [Mycena albidolilacea]|uniref:Uncharacterized protein n=1 Tax=Mycena albidolilacea TaxID=1033008 RepID=A0AAD6Z3P8_9AGAR|nr:hypothetical protein DFH08DRAFT_825126 [Mycena albidolilacea]